MNFAEHILHKFNSGTLKGAKLSKLCESATPQHSTGKRVWLFSDGSKIIAIGKGPLRQVTAEAPPIPQDLLDISDAALPENSANIYAIRLVRISPIGKYEESLQGITRHQGVAMAQARALQDPNIESKEIITLTIVKRARAL